MNSQNLKLNAFGKCWLIATGVVAASALAISVYTAYQSKHKTNQPISQIQNQAPISQGQSLQRIARENGGTLELIGTTDKEPRRKDLDGDGICDIQQICSNGNVFYLSSKAMSNDNIKCWYSIEGEPTQ